MKILRSLSSCVDSVATQLRYRHVIHKIAKLTATAFSSEMAGPNGTWRQSAIPRLSELKSIFCTGDRFTIETVKTLLARAIVTPEPVKITLRWADIDEVTDRYGFAAGGYDLSQFAQSLLSVDKRRGSALPDISGHEQFRRYVSIIASRNALEGRSLTCMVDAYATPMDHENHRLALPLIRLRNCDGSHFAALAVHQAKTQHLPDTLEPWVQVTSLNQQAVDDLTHAFYVLAVNRRQVLEALADSGIPYAEMAAPTSRASAGGALQLLFLPRHHPGASCVAKTLLARRRDGIVLDFGAQLAQWAANQNLPHAIGRIMPEAIQKQMRDCQQQHLQAVRCAELVA